MSTPRRPPRQRLIEAMIDVCAREGYAQSSIAEVIETAAASRSTFYEHFSDKDDCFLAALGELSGELALGVRAAVTGEAPEADDTSDGAATEAASVARGLDVGPVHAGVTALMMFAKASPAGARVLFLESLAAGPEGLAIRDQLIERIAETIERGASALCASLPTPGASQPIPDVPALGLICGTFRLLSMRLTVGEAALPGLEDDLQAWVHSYSTTAPRQWQGDTPLARVVTEPAERPPKPPPPQVLPRGRHGLSAAEVAKSQRERIMAAVASESFEKGYGNVTVTDVVASASISRNVFYEQFSDKQEAAIAALQDGFERAFASTASSFFEGESWPERIWRIGQRLTEHYLSHPADAYLSFVELHCIGEEAVRLAHERLRVFTLLLEEGYSLRSARLPEEQPLPRLVSEALVATVLELGYRQAPHRGAKVRPVLLGQQAYMCLAPFIGPEAASGLVAEELGVDLSD